MPKPSKMKMSISSNEIIFPNSHFYLESEYSFDPQTSQGALVVGNQSGQVDFQRGINVRRGYLKSP